MKEADWIGSYEQKEALWIHDGNSKRPHALLTSGKHSSGFFNSRPVIADEVLLWQAAQDLTYRLLADVVRVDRVVGPQTGATKLAEFISDDIGWRRSAACKWASPAKSADGLEKKLVWDDPDRKVLSGEIILLCEDVLTTGGSVALAAKAATDAGGIVLPFIAVLVNRSGLSEADGKKIVALIDRPMPIWLAGDCPLCKAGSEAIRPKDEVNWARLNANYTRET